MRGLFLPHSLLIYFIFLLAVTNLAAQEQKPLEPVSDAYAITNVTIIPAPGSLIEKGVIIIRKGLIDNIGKDLPIPPEAIVINADSMFAYAAFIEGLSHTGVTKPREEDNERVPDPGNPPPAIAGINPHNDVRDFLDPADHSIKELRCAGFGASQVVPHGIFLPGTSAVILLSGNSADEMAMKPRSSCYAELSWNRTVYPSTVMALLAKWRELYHQAELAKAYETLYAAGSNGMQRPASSRILESFYPVLEKRRPVLFKAEKILDLQRVLHLQKELGFVLVLADVKEGWDIANKIKASGARVFLSLDLPEDMKPDKKVNDEIKKDSVADPEITALEMRRAEFVQKMVSQAIVFDSAGVKFGFSVMDVRYSDIHKNLIRMLEAGLTKETALAALTVNAAELLGIDDRLGTLDKGKIANVVIFDKPIFDKEAKVRMVFVEGKLHECEQKKSAKNGGTDTALEGHWSFIAETLQEKINFEVVFNRKPDNQLGGTISGGRLQKAIAFTSVTQKGKMLRFTYNVDVEGKAYEVTVEGALEGKTFNGKMSLGEYGRFPIQGTKDPNH